jgi:hypothetical protein
MPIGDSLWGDSQYGDSPEDLVVALSTIDIVFSAIAADEYRASGSPNPSVLDVLLSLPSPTYVVNYTFNHTVYSLTINLQTPNPSDTVDIVYLPSVISFVCTSVPPIMIGSGDLVTLTAISISSGVQSPTITFSCNLTMNAISLQALAQAVALVSNDCGVSVAVQALQFALQSIRVNRGNIGDEILTSDELIAGWWDCDECGFTYQKTKLLERWDGALVCNKCYETQHPLDEVYTY